MKDSEEKLCLLIEAEGPQMPGLFFFITFEPIEIKPNIFLFF